LNAFQLLDRLRSIGVRLAVEGGRLRVSAARGALTHELKEAIRAQKAALFTVLQQGAATQSKDLIRVRRTECRPLSLFQQRLWVMHRLDPASTAFNMVTSWPSAGSLSVEQMQHAIRDVVRRHEILRTTFHGEDTELYGRLLPVEAVSIMVRDLRDRSHQEMDEIINAEMAEAAHTPFDLALEAPLRWILYRVGEDRVATVVAMHHIAMDEWSLALLRSEIAAACKAAAENAPPRAPASLQYLDYADWQRRNLVSSEVGAELDWWTEHLAGIPQLCTFLPDQPTGITPSGAAYVFRWSAELTVAIRSLSRESGVTVYMALLAACAVALRVHTGQGDITLGSPMGMRERPEFETMIGPFVNPLVLRVDLRDDPTFADLLARARETVLDAHDHRHVPFEMLVERLNPVRTFERSPVFQVAVVMHNASGEPGSAIQSGGAIHDLTWFAREVDGRLEGSLEYRSDLYTAEAVGRIASQLETVLRAAVDDRGRRISTISLLTAADRRQVVEGFNDTACAVDTATFVEQFERQAAAAAEACAVCFEGHELSYGALNQRSNLLARHLRSRGIGPGSLVGLCTGRSLDMVVGLLGIQKAGAAHVPLDPDLPLPRDRLNFVLTDSGITAVVTAGETSPPLPATGDLQIIDLKLLSTDLEGIDASNPERVAGAEDVAYVIYTSGSTGQPNGVAVSHGALSNFLGAMKRTPGLAPTDILAAVTTISFDIAVLELCLPLITGARIELISRDVASDGRALADRLSASGTTVLQATPATWRLLIDAGWQGHPDFTAFCGGETLTRDLADAVLARVGSMWNLYGPTETTVWSMAEHVVSDGKPISVGRPIANTQVYVLDAAGEPTPVGVTGEIWIGGKGLAIGYHRRPGLTAERFVPDRFSTAEGARVYRTGDVGRWQVNGHLVHMGRMDRQVKIRGFRVEPAEVESVLCTHPSISRAIVAARDAGLENLRLVAYVVYRPGRDLTASEARLYLRQRLPDYMVPSLFVALNAVPMTASGKVDMRALPDPFFKNARRLSEKHTPPSPGAEQLIAKVWQEILEVDRIGADDNFFELGGHSLLSLRAVAAIERQTGWRMPPRSLFFQTLRQIAAAIPLEQTRRLGNR
jgi:amino acid adenylation domain-containing protein